MSPRFFSNDNQLFSMLFCRIDWPHKHIFMDNKQFAEQNLKKTIIYILLLDALLNIFKLYLRTLMCQLCECPSVFLPNFEDLLMFA